MICLTVFVFQLALQAKLSKKPLPSTIILHPQLSLSILAHFLSLFHCLRDFDFCIAGWQSWRFAARKIDFLVREQIVAVNCRPNNDTMKENN